MAKSTGLNTAGADTCYICLSPFGKQAVGSVESCQHVFCLECILQWSQTANTCPVDRIRFAFIHQRRCPGGDIQKKIQVRTQKKDVNEDDYDYDEEEGSDAVTCEECGRSDRRHRLLACIHCDSAYHVDCLTPSLNTGPEGGFTVEEKISDGELTELLVGGAASASGRLRPSTTNHRSSSPERRHSQRIQSRASADPEPRPQTSWHVPKYLLPASKPAATTDEVAALTSNAPVKLKTRKRRKRAA